MEKEVAGIAGENEDLGPRGAWFPARCTNLIDELLFHRHKVRTPDNFRPEFASTGANLGTLD
jgi:hypothetical protein